MRKLLLTCRLLERLLHGHAELDEVEEELQLRLRLGVGARRAEHHPGFPSFSASAGLMVWRTRFTGCSELTSFDRGRSTSSGRSHQPRAFDDLPLPKPLSRLEVSETMLWSLSTTVR